MGVDSDSLNIVEDWNTDLRYTTSLRCSRGTVMAMLSIFSSGTTANNRLMLSLTEVSPSMKSTGAPSTRVRSTTVANREDAERLLAYVIALRDKEREAEKNKPVDASESKRVGEGDVKPRRNKPRPLRLRVQSTKAEPGATDAFRTRRHPSFQRTERARAMAPPLRFPLMEPKSLELPRFGLQCLIFGAL